MDLRTSEAMQIASLSVKKKSLIETIGKKQEQIASIEEVIMRLQEQVTDIDEDITKINIRAAKEAENNAEADAPEEVQEEVEEVEESDAATTTGSLDASSSSSGGPSGWKGSGWKFYDKVGPIQKRKRCSDKDSDCKNENIEEPTYKSFLDGMWEVDGGE